MRDLDTLIDSTLKYYAKGHTRHSYGIWEVRGEDPNCDLGGAHHNPLLGYFEGTLEDVMKHAMDLSGFWQWGAGGHLSPASDTITGATIIGEGAKQKTRERNIDNLLHDATEFAKEKLGKEYKDDDTVEIKFCDLVKMLKDYEKDGDKKS